MNFIDNLRSIKQRKNLYFELIIKSIVKFKYFKYYGFKYVIYNLIFVDIVYPSLN